MAPATSAREDILTVITMPEPMTPAAVERLLTLPNRLAATGRLEELLQAAAAALAEEAGARCTVQWLADGPSDDAAGADAPGRVLLEIIDRGSSLARLQLERESAFSSEERRLLAHVAQGLSQLVTINSKRLQTRLLEELSLTLPGSASLAEAATQALKVLISHLSARAGVLIRSSAAGPIRLAMVGEWAAPPPEDIVVSEAAVAGAMRLVGDGVALTLVGDDRPARWLLLLQFPRTDQLPAYRQVLEQAARVLVPYLGAHWRTEVLAELLELHDALTDAPTEGVYDRMLAAAIRLVPGADSGSLLTRRTPRDPFSFQAAQGFDLEELRSTHLPYDQVRGWYGSDEAGWRHGRPRLLRRDRDDIESFGTAATPNLSDSAAAYDSIQASLCVPVSRDGEVLAMLNLENQCDPTAFGNDSVEIAHMFGPPLASLLNQQHLRELLRHAALTDELTGLPNRRAFDESFRRELARRSRGTGSVTVLLMDLRGFKRVNDTAGHEAGDRALVLVAQALRGALREADLLCRWGGDEFAAILADASEAEVVGAAARLKQAVSAVIVYGHQLDVDIGQATYPEDGSAPGQLLAVADRRMYGQKREGEHAC